MANRPDAYVRKDPGDIIRSGDWNELQIRTREELHAHKHTGNDDGSQIERSGIAANAIDGSLIDPAANVTVNSLVTKGDLSVNGKMILGEITDLLAKVKGLDTDKLDRNTGSFTGTLSIQKDLLVTGGIAVGASLPQAKLHIVNLSQDAPTGNTFILGPATDVSHLGLGYHDNYSWIQSYGGKPLALNPAGLNVGIGTTTPRETLEVNGRIMAGQLTMGSWPTSSSYAFFGNNQLDQSNSVNYALLQGTGGDTYLNSPSNLYIGISNSYKMQFTSDGKTWVYDKFQAGQLGMGLWPASSSYSFIGTNNLDQTKAVNYALLQDNNTGNTFLNSPAALFLRIGNGDKLTIDHNGNSTIFGNLNVTGRISGKLDRSISPGNTWQAIMQDDSNFVVYTINGQPIWSSNGGRVSDLNLKTDIKPLENPLTRLLSLRGVSFSWKDETHGKDREIGVIAQEVEKVFPEVVNTVTDHKLVNYIGLIPVLIEAIKEQQKQIDELRESIKPKKSFF